MDRHRNTSVPVIAALLATLWACNSSSSPGEESRVVSGPVELVNVEGGCLVFHGEDGVDYQLFAAPEVGLAAVYEHNAFLEVELVPRPNMAGFCPGVIAEVLRVISASLPLGIDDFRLIRSEENGAESWGVEDWSGR